MLPPPHQQKTPLVDVLLPFGHKPFTYQLNNTHHHAPLGYRVVVPFQKRFTVGIIWRTHTSPPPPTVKTIANIPDNVPIWDATQRRFLQWISSYYSYPLGHLAKLALSSISPLFKIHLAAPSQPHPQPPISHTPSQQLLATLQEVKGLSWKQATHIMPATNLLEALHILIKHKRIQLVKPLFPSKPAWYIALNKPYTPDNPPPLKTKKQQATLATYTTLAQQHRNPWVALSQLQKQASTAIIKHLVAKQILVKQKRIQPTHTPPPSPSAAPQPPTLPQHYHHINQLWQQKNTILVAGKGIIDHPTWLFNLFLASIAPNQQGLLLVPAITPALQQLIQKHNHYIILYHPALSKKQQHQRWTQVAQGKARWIIGTQHALFLPYQRLTNLYIAQEATYTQPPPTIPHLHTRNAAIMLAHHHNAKTLLADYVVSLGSYHNAKTGKYAYLPWQGKPLHTRKLQLITNNEKINNTPPILATAMHHKIETALSNHQPIIVIVQRKGYASYHLCTSCNTIPQCPHCHVNLRFHQALGLICHHCSYKVPPFTACPTCHSVIIKQGGVGIQQVAELLSIFFPTKKIHTIETAYGKAYQQKQQMWQQGTIDIVVCLPNIALLLAPHNQALIIIADIDKWLYTSHFRAQETTYQYIAQLITHLEQHTANYQLCLQTPPWHRPLLHELAGYFWRNNFESFYTKMLQERRAYGYPPYSKILHLCLSHKQATVLDTFQKTFVPIVENKWNLTVYTKPSKNYTGNIQRIFWLKVASKHHLIGQQIGALAQQLLKEAPYKGLKMNIAFH